MSVVAYRFNTTGVLDPTPQETTSDRIVTRALLIVEGKFIDANGNPSNFSPKRLEAIAAATNKYLESGEDTPVFLSMHDFNGGYDPRNIVGQLQDGVFVSEITESDLPDPGMTDIVGKQGLFGLIELSDKDAIERYNSGRNKKISVGLGWVGKDVIFEVSLVPWGVIRGAALFSAGEGREEPITLGTLPPALYSILMGLTMGESKAEDAMMRQVSMIFQDWMVFEKTINDIRDADEIPEGRSKEGLISQAIADLATALRSRLQVSNSEPPPTVPLFGLATMITDNKQEPNQDQNPTQETAAPAPDHSEQFAKMEAAIAAANARAEAAEAKAQELQQQQQVASRYSRLKSKAESLVRQFKLTPADFKAKFGEEEETAIALFCKPPEGQERKYNLDFLESYLESVEQFAVPVRPVPEGGSHVVELPGESDNLETELHSFPGYDPNFK